MQELSDILAEAAQSVSGPYFSLPVENGDDAQLERNYCYELFHQMRLRWPSDCKYTLSAEVDKRRHPVIGQLQGGRVIPDLLVHTPGSMAGNHAIIEIKRAQVSASGIRKDLRSLTRFMASDIHYERGLYLLFGGADVALVKHVAAINNADGRIELWCHDKAGEPAYRVD